MLSSVQTVWRIIAEILSEGAIKPFEARRMATMSRRQISGVLAKVANILEYYADSRPIKRSLPLLNRRKFGITDEEEGVDRYKSCLLYTSDAADE